MKKSAQVHKGLASLRSGFTLVELLVVIAIIAILAAVIVLIINPLELTRRGRDAARLTDLSNLQQAINVAVQEATSSGQNIACNGSAGLCNDATTRSNTGTRATNGTGWVKLNLGVQTSVSVPTLPVDPANDTTYHYTYCGNGENWEIRTALESQQQIPKMSNDGGTDNATYQVGSQLDMAGCTY